MIFIENDPQHQILTICQILEVSAKNLEAALFLPKEIVRAIMILYRNMKVKVYLPDGDIDCFNIISGVLQGNTLAPYLFIICLDYVFQTSIDLTKENGFTLKKERTRQYPTETLTDAVYVDDIELFTYQSQIPAA